MLGRQDPQLHLFRPDHVYRSHVGEDTFYGLLATQGRELFRDDHFADLYREAWGRPSVPPSQLCIALLLQAREGVSDDEAIQRSAYDLRWKVALGLELDEKLCAKSTLQLFRAKLVLHERFGAVFEASVAACRKAGMLKRRKLEVAVDTTPVLGRGAVKDTFNLISDQIRRVIGEIVALKGWSEEELVAGHGLGRHFGTSFKGEVELDWSDPDEKRALVGQLVADARVVLDLARQALRGYGRGRDAVRSLREGRGLLSELLLQDIEEEPEDGGGPRIQRGTSKDRIVSTTDPDMRHGHKSHARAFDGYKASIAVDTASGVIVATGAQAANAQDRDGLEDLVEGAEKTTKSAVESVIGDTAYGDLGSREKMAEREIEVVAKAPPGKRAGYFSREDFRVDERMGVATCPAGRQSIRRDRCKRKGEEPGWMYVFSRKDCGSCGLRPQCTRAKVAARHLVDTPKSKELWRLRREQKTRRFKKKYRRRIVVEHRIGRLVQLGLRQARYFGQAKVAYQISITATVANLMLLSG